MPGATVKSDYRNYTITPSAGPPAMPMSTFHPFSQLPEELKLHILRERLVLPRPISAISHASNSIRLLHPLALANKALNNLTITVYYGENTFFIQHCSTKWRPSMQRIGTEKMFCYPNTAIGIWVCKIEVRIIIQSKVLYDTRSDDIHYINSQWPYLLVDHTKTNQLAACVTWQQSFPKLREMKVVVDFGFDFHVQSCLVKIYDTFMSRLKQHSIEIRARQVEAEVNGVSCEKKCNRWRKLCNKRCAENVKKAIEDMIKA